MLDSCSLGSQGTLMPERDFTFGLHFLGIKEKALTKAVIENLSDGSIINNLMMNLMIFMAIGRLSGF